MSFDRLGVVVPYVLVAPAVILNHDGSLRIERGFVRHEDESSKDKSGGDDVGGAGKEEPSDVGDDGDGRSSDNEQPDLAMIATIHARVAQTFFRQDVSCLDIRPNSTALAVHAEALADRHDRWAVQLPKSPSDLWDFVVALDYDSHLALFAHCAALTSFAVKAPWEKKPRAWATADTLATVLGLDMTAQPPSSFSPEPAGCRP